MVGVSAARSPSARRAPAAVAVAAPVPEDLYDLRPLDPATPFREVPTAADLRYSLHRDRVETARVLERARTAASRRERPRTMAVALARSQLGVALLSGLLAVVLLYVINPPFTQRARVSPALECERQDVRKVLLASLSVAALAYLAGDAVRLLCVRAVR